MPHLIHFFAPSLPPTAEKRWAKVPCYVLFALPAKGRQFLGPDKLPAVVRYMRAIIALCREPFLCVGHDDHCVRVRPATAADRRPAGAQPENVIVFKQVFLSGGSCFTAPLAHDGAASGREASPPNVRAAGRRWAAVPCCGAVGACWPWAGRRGGCHW